MSVKNLKDTCRIDENAWDELVSKLPMCKIALTDQADALKSSGQATSDREAAEIIAEETGYKTNSIRMAIKRRRSELKRASGYTVPKVKKVSKYQRVKAENEQLKKQLKYAEYMLDEYAAENQYFNNAMKKMIETIEKLSKQ